MSFQYSNIKTCYHRKTLQSIIMPKWNCQEKVDRNNLALVISKKEEN